MPKEQALKIVEVIQRATISHYEVWGEDDEKFTELQAIASISETLASAMRALSNKQGDGDDKPNQYEGRTFREHLAHVALLCVLHAADYEA